MRQVASRVTQNPNLMCLISSNLISSNLMCHSYLLGGVFAQRGHSANCYVPYPGNTPETHQNCHISMKR